MSLDSAHGSLLWKYIRKHHFYWATGSINFSLKVNPFATAATTALPSFNPHTAICNCFVPWVEWTHAHDWMHSRHWSEPEISGVFCWRNNTSVMPTGIIPKTKWTTIWITALSIASLCKAVEQLEAKSCWGERFSRLPNILLSNLC